jgi:hypothetical protein
MLNDAMKNAPVGKLLGLSIVFMENVATVTEDEHRIACSADVTYNNTNKTNLAYTFYKKGGRIYVEARPSE